MNTKTTIGIVFIASLMLAIIHYLSINLHWYYYYPYVDIAMHLLGGFVTALFGYYVLRTGSTTRITAEFSLVVIIGLLTVVTVG